MRLLVVAPGRGSYGPREIGSLARIANESDRGHVLEGVAAAFALAGGPDIHALDRGPFSPEHLRPENASALIFAGSVLDFSLLPADATIAGVSGNSLGFYTALALSGALPLEEGARLVATMARLQAKLAKGEQLIYPWVDDEWRAVPARVEAIAAAIAAGKAFPSIHLGGFAVLAAPDARAVSLPTARQGGRDYPLVLEGHQGYHSPLAAPVALAAQAELDLPFAAPRVHLIDGRGAIFTPWSTDPDELALYALAHQVREPFDLTATLRTAARELAPDAFVLLGPGESIGGAIGQALVHERFQGLATKEAFMERQRSDKPVLYALGRADQRLALLGAAR